MVTQLYTPNHQIVRFKEENSLDYKYLRRATGPMQGAEKEAAHSKKHLYKQVITKDTFPGPAFQDSDQ